MQSADTAKGSGFNFEPITFEDKPENVMQNLFLSVKNLRKNLVIDSSSRKQVEIAQRMKRTSYLAELECKLCIALNCRNPYPTYENSSFFNLLQEFMENFFDKSDVVADILPYLKLMQPDDALALREKIRSKIEAIEAGIAMQQLGAAGAG
jgi:hypothetical protein